MQIFSIVNTTVLHASWLRTVDTESQILGDDRYIQIFNCMEGWHPQLLPCPYIQGSITPKSYPAPIFRGQLLLLLHIRKFPPCATRGQQKTSHFSNSSVVAAARVEISQLRSFTTGSYWTFPDLNFTRKMGRVVDRKTLRPLQALTGCDFNLLLVSLSDYSD